MQRKGAKAQRRKEDRRKAKNCIFNLYFLTQMTLIFEDATTVMFGLQKISVADAREILGHL
jgi:hypothetical protein